MNFLRRVAYRSTLLVVLLSACPLMADAGPGKTNDFKGRRVLFIGIDGMRRDVLRKIMDEGGAPHLQQIARQSLAFWNMEAGGYPLGMMSQPTISGPGWTTLLTGVFANKHKVTGNGPKFSQGDFVRYPHFYSHLRKAYPNSWLGSIACKSWPEVNTILLKGSGEGVANHIASPEAVTTVDEAGVKRYDDDANVTIDAVKCLKENDPDVLFVHYLTVDHQGHGSGFAHDVPNYVSAVKKTDQYIGELLSALEARPQYKDESWLIVVTSDHGGVNKVHGGQSQEERQIATFFRGEGFTPGEQTEGRVFQTLVTPTVLSFLGVAIDPAWGMEDQSVTPAVR